jgi:formylglycine-generating enzyme required for sulfatase activity
MPRLLSSLLLSLGIASSASAVTMDWTDVGNPGNACDTTGAPSCVGAVSYGYEIGTYEVTNAQYAEFLNAVASSDPHELYNTNMASSGPGFYGGITRGGASGSYSYTAIAGREEMPVNYVSFYDTVRFANWMSNGQGSGSTEAGSYTLLGPGPTPTNPVTRNVNPTIVLPNENEWYKAAYYDASTASYFDFPLGSDALPVCSAPSAAPGTANCNFAAAGDFSPRGGYPSAASPYGTFDQGGNAWEWTETVQGISRVQRGGGIDGPDYYLGSNFRTTASASQAFNSTGFRIAQVPEPSTGLLVIGGLLGLAASRRTRS